MSAYASANVLDNGIQYIKTNCDKLVVVPSYTPGDSYATVMAAALAEVTMTSTDFTLASSGSDRTCTSASGKQDASANASGGSASNHFVFLYTGNTEVLSATTETTGQSITAGNPVNFPSLVYTAKQPTVV